MKKIVSIAALATFATLAANAEIRLSVDETKAALEVPKTLYGIFFEDINWAADGGIYAEMVANRGFDWRTPTPSMWEYDFRGGAEARITLEWAKPLYPENAQYLRIECIGVGEGGGCGVKNRGFANGMRVEAGKAYNLKFYARGVDGYKGNIRAQLVAKGETLAEFTVENNDLNIGKAGATPFDRELADWKRYAAVFTPEKTSNEASLSILLDAPGIVDLEFVSLFPQDTWKGQENGLRKDLVEMLAALKPGIIRFPGGCIAEGDDFASWYDWKRSVGPVERRYLNENRWDMEGKPLARNLKYWQTEGLGYFEYFRLCEDLGAEPLPICLSGLTCQYRRPTHFAPMESLDYFVTNILDLVEFATGDAATNPWAKIRAEMGHPAPFALHYVGIGNENWDEKFFERFDVIAKAVKAVHPEIMVVSSSGPMVDEGRWERGWKFLSDWGAEIIDEHYYKSPEWFLANANRYDNYSRKAPKVYAGEYACHDLDRTNTVRAAICEAAMMCGFERNCDVVAMSSYAPLFNNIDATGYHWRPDMIWFDKAHVYPTPSYAVQKLFSANRPDFTLPLKMETVGSPVTERFFYSAGKMADGTVLVKLVNAGKTPLEVKIDLGDILAAKDAESAKITVETLSGDPDATGDDIKHETSTITPNCSLLTPNCYLTLPPWSATVVKIKE